MTSKAVKIIKDNIHRSMVDHYPNYAHAVAVYNDLLRQIEPGSEYNIRYEGDDCVIL